MARLEACTELRCFCCPVLALLTEPSRRLTGYPSHGGPRLSGCSPASAPPALSSAPLQPASSLTPLHFRYAYIHEGVCTLCWWLVCILDFSCTLQVAAAAAVAAVVYMRAFVQETDCGASLLRDEETSRPLCLPSSSTEEASPRLPPLLSIKPTPATTIQVKISSHQISS